jgi:hypothetical protein
MAAPSRFHTPPRDRDAVLHYSATRSNGVLINFITLGGRNLGSMSVTRDTRLVDVKDKILACFGSTLGYQPRLVLGTVAFDKPASKPFAQCRGGETFTVLRKDMDDASWVDASEHQDV